MEKNIISSILLPATLAFIMLGMGLSLTIGDFKRVIVAPKAIIIGLIAQMVLLPIIGFLLIQLFGLTGALAVGLMILAACPGGPTSNLISHLAKADLAISITLTAISSILCVFTIPLIVNFSINYFGEAGSVQLPIMETVLQIVVVTIIPVSIGMLIRGKATDFALKADKPVKILSAIFFTIILLLAIGKEWQTLVSNFTSLGPVIIVLNLLTMVVGLFLASAFKLPIKQRVAIAIETGIQNGTLGIMIAVTILGSSQMALPIAGYGILMFISAIFVIIVGNRVIH
jgi:BASS family bile acid:Na+ symporter